jgi:hypothetical protein
MGVLGYSERVALQHEMPDLERAYRARTQFFQAFVSGSELPAPRGLAPKKSASLIAQIAALKPRKKKPAHG